MACNVEIETVLAAVAASECSLVRLCEKSYAPLGLSLFRNYSTGSRPWLHSNAATAAKTVPISTL